MSSQYYRHAVVIFLLAVTFLGCRKNNAPESLSFAREHIFIEKSLADILEITDQVYNYQINHEQIQYKLSHGKCAVIDTMGDSTYINFGATNCLGKDDRFRRGVIKVYGSTVDFLRIFATHTIKFDDFYVDNNRFSGTIEVHNLGTTISGLNYYGLTYKCIVTFSSGASTVIDWTRTRICLIGDRTSSNEDNIYTYSGSGTATRTGSEGFTGVIFNYIDAKTALESSPFCKQFEQGNVLFSLPDGNERLVDFGTTPVCAATANYFFSGDTAAGQKYQALDLW